MSETATKENLGKEVEKEETGPGHIRLRNRALILQAAEEVFAEQGYRGATTAAIAERAGLPKANVHYYFGTKETLYRAVLDDILALWLGELDRLTEDSDPAEALADYIKAKVVHSRERPLASRVYANEMIRGAKHTGDFLKNDLKSLVKRKSRVLESWVAQGKMEPIDPVHLFSVIWAATQHYADFEVQVAALVGRRQMTARDFDEAADTIVRMVLRGCGLHYGKAAE
ncbi:TetR family transcriptional regulator [Pelagibius litoralis]|uniref:TetR family transcriptional regulator n=1 Tax=Pelagibius litoralis TaxID=374515 RepID=A0A967EX48_9PROT|nr:TetR/AcrR family transcriptional regulator [Pelagibius litoralis]NIA67685.1 TetR family transcriptional regulator [Pelagibius litoralis]